MGNLIKENRETINLNELGIMLKLVSMEYPKYSNNPFILSNLISEEFNVICTEEDIKGYHQLHIQQEDFELESRKQENGIIY